MRTTEARRSILAHALLATGVAVALLTIPPAPEASAQATFSVEGGTPIKKALEGRVGMPVTLRLAGGAPEISGTVVAVGDGAVYITQVGGMELFDALVRTDEIAAVLVRRAAKP